MSVIYKIEVKADENGVKVLKVEKSEDNKKISNLGKFLKTLEAKQQVAQKSIAESVKRTKLMKKHDREIMRDRRIGWKAKKEFLRKRKGDKTQAEATVGQLRKEEDEREKKIRKLESQMFCLLRNCQ